MDNLPGAPVHGSLAWSVPHPPGVRRFMNFRCPLARTIVAQVVFVYAVDDVAKPLLQHISSRVNNSSLQWKHRSLSFLT